MSRPSAGDRRVLANTAGMLTAGMMMTRPSISAGSSVRESSESAIGPSYSSPWTPPVSSTVGPLPWFRTTIGISTMPQPEVLRDIGARR